MKILCFTDFSEVATNAVEYAANVAKAMNAKLTLLSLQEVHVREGVSMFAGGERESVMEADQKDKSLTDICGEISKSFQIRCDHRVMYQPAAFSHMIGNETEKYDLFVVGTNGVDSALQAYFGNFGYVAAKVAECPVLLVPFNSRFKSLDNIVFASDYRKGDIILLDQLKRLTGVFNPQLHVLHISKDNDHISREVHNSYRNLFEDAFDMSTDILFKRIVSHDPERAIMQYMNDSKADLLALYFQPHSVVYRFLHDNLIKHFTAYVDFPLLLLHK